MVIKKSSKKKSAPKKKSASKKKSVTKKKRSTTKRKTTRKRGTTKIKYESTKEIKMDKRLMDNFVALQKVMVNLSVKFDDLSKQISKLLNLFEISAKALAQKDTKEDKGERETEKIMQKLDNISQQAGLIGKGLALIHDINKEEGKPGLPTISPQHPRPIPPQQPKPMPMRKPGPQPKQPGRPGPARKPPQESPTGMAGYQKSISSRVREENV